MVSRKSALPRARPWRSATATSRPALPSPRGRGAHGDAVERAGRLEPPARRAQPRRRQHVALRDADLAPRDRVARHREPADLDGRERRLAEPVPLGERLGVAAGHLQRGGEQLARVRVVADRERPPQVRDRLVVAPVEEAQAAALDPRLGTRGLERHGAIEERAGLGRLPVAAERDGLLHEPVVGRRRRRPAAPRASAAPTACPAPRVGRRLPALLPRAGCTSSVQRPLARQRASRSLAARRSAARPAPGRSRSPRPAPRRIPRAPRRGSARGRRRARARAGGPSRRARGRAPGRPRRRARPSPGRARTRRGASRGCRAARPPSARPRSPPAARPGRSRRAPSRARPRRRCPSAAPRTARGDPAHGRPSARLEHGQGGEKHSGQHARPYFKPRASRPPPVNHS